MSTRIGTEYFVNKNSAMRYYSSQWQSSGVEAKIKEGAIKFGMPPRKEGYRIVLNNKEGRYFYEEVAQAKPVDLTAVAQQGTTLNPNPVVALAATAGVPATIDAEKLAQTTVLSRAESEDLKATVESVSAQPLQADELVPVPLISEGDPVPEFAKAAEGFCGFCMKPTDQCECKGVGENLEPEQGLNNETAQEPERTEGANPNLAAPYTAVQAAPEAKVVIKTNNVPRELLFFSALTDKERAELDYVKEDTNSFFRLKDQVYDAGEFFRIVHPGQTDPHPAAHRDDSDHFKGWDAIFTTSYSTGVVIRYPRIDGDEIDPERVIIGTFYITSADAEEPKDPRAENNVPNLDAENDVEKLREFATKHDGGKRIKDLFPSGGEGTKNAAKDLAHYAWNKLTALELRKKGKVAKAQEYEEICDKIYKDLPTWARGW